MGQPNLAPGRPRTFGNAITLELTSWKALTVLRDYLAARFPDEKFDANEPAAIVKTAIQLLEPKTAHLVVPAGYEPRP